MNNTKDQCHLDLFFQKEKRINNRINNQNIQRDKILINNEKWNRNHNTSTVMQRIEEATMKNYAEKLDNLEQINIF